MQLVEPVVRYYTPGDFMRYDDDEPTTIVDIFRRIGLVLLCTLAACSGTVVVISVVVTLCRMLPF